MQEYRDALRAEHRRAKAEQKRANPLTDKSKKASPKKNEKAQPSPVSEPIKTAEELAVYRQISKKNHDLNELYLGDLRRICREENINGTGKRGVVIQRLKQHFKFKILRFAGLLESRSTSGFDYILVIDFEATCEEERNHQYPHEIIEFPAVLVDVDKCEIVDKWQKYVKPKINPKLSTFCTELTGIQQETVDKADDFLTVLNQFEDWLRSKGLGTKHTFAVATDGPFDIARFLLLSCQHENIKLPKWACKWINVRKHFLNFYKRANLGVRVTGLSGMLDWMGLAFQGSPHCGLDDAINIARVVTRLLNDGCNFRVNEQICFAGVKDRWLSTMAPVNKDDAMLWLEKCKDFKTFDHQESESDSDNRNEGTNEDTHSEYSTNEDDVNEDINDICGDNFAKQCDINDSDAR